MKLSGYILLCFAFLPLFCNSQQLELKYLIDDFSVYQQTLITLSGDLLATDPPVVDTSFEFTPSNTTIGGERDMELRVFQGSQGRTFFSQTNFTGLGGGFDFSWQISNANSGSMSATNQYDGDDQSFGLNFTGLNVDLAQVSVITVFYNLDLNTTMEINLYDFYGTACTISRILYETTGATDPVSK